VEERENDVECWEKKKGVLKVETIGNGLSSVHLWSTGTDTWHDTDT